VRLLRDRYDVAGLLRSLFVDLADAAPPGPDYQEGYGVTGPATKKSLPYLPMYVGDFLKTTFGWTLAERGAYLMLLLASWEHGPLPKEMLRLAMIAGTSQAEFEALWPRVRQRFVETDAGLVNEPLEGHRAKYAKFREKQTENGRTGMRTRWRCPICDSKLTQNRCLSCGYQRESKPKLKKDAFKPAPTTAELEELEAKRKVSNG
jgi:uncharacterized protein YdaU (DUF1376 family)